MFPVIAAIPCMLGVATKYCQSEKIIVVAFFYDLAWAYVCTFSPTRLCGPGNLLSNIFCLPAVRSSDAQ